MVYRWQEEQNNFPPQIITQTYLFVFLNLFLPKVELVKMFRNDNHFHFVTFNFGEKGSLYWMKPTT